MVGLGVGSLPDENAALGVPYESRGAFSNEFLQVLKVLWTEPSASFQGKFFNFNDVISSPQPLQKPHPPLMIGGNADPALRRMARYGDGWHPMSLPPASVAKRLPKIQAEAERANRSGVPNAIQIRLAMENITPELIAEYESLGVTELVLSLNTGEVAEIETGMMQFAQTYLRA